MTALVFIARTVPPLCDDREPIVVNGAKIVADASAGKLNAAIQLAGLRLRLFELHGAWSASEGGALRCTCSDLACSYNAKHPRQRGWQDAATSDVAVAAAIWGNRPVSNIGIRTGLGVDVVDVDDQKGGGGAAMARLVAEHGPLPPTPTVITGRGVHLYFRTPSSPISNSQGKIAAGIDYRGAGGYALGVGSLHFSGRVYRWAEGRSPEDVKLAVMPPWLEALARGEISSAKVARPANHWAQFMRGRVPRGQRNAALTQMAGYLFWRGIDRDVVLEFVWLWSRARFDDLEVDPVSADEVAKTVASIWLTEQRKREAFR